MAAMPAKGLSQIDPDYLQQLAHSGTGFRPQKYSMHFPPLDQVNYVLFGESPYPREESANGYAFWDASVKELWSETGPRQKVNRATSLRNMLKMLLIAENMLDKNDQSQQSIARLNKQSLYKPVMPCSIILFSMDFYY